MALLKSHQREKLINAIIYFAENTLHCGKTKLFKLLYLLDFEHFRQTGRSVTGLDYFAWAKGPVPASLNEELDEPGDDFVSSFEIVCKQIIDHQRQAVVPIVDFDPSYFSKRELRILDQISRNYCGAYSKQMIDVTHAENEAWTKIYDDGKGFNHQIPYETALTEEERGTILPLEKESEEMRANYR